MVKKQTRVYYNTRVIRHARGSEPSKLRHYLVSIKCDFFFIIPLVKECHVVSGNLDYRSTQKWKRKSMTNDQPFWFILFSSWFQFSHSPLTINMSSLQQFYGGHHDFVHRYGLFVSQMTTDMFITILSFPHSLNHQGCNRSNTTCATCRAGSVYPSRAPEFAQVFKIVLVEFVLFTLSNYMFSSF